ncbi:MAG TPA: DNA translocase FtsK [Firmicutes bacterium]|nr:DNA translocase FtsK [Bacillota bacterium]
MVNQGGLATGSETKLVSSRRRGEIIGIIVMAVAIFGLIGLYWPVTGVVGKYMTEVCRWLLGSAAPIALLILFFCGGATFLKGYVGTIGRSRTLALILLGLVLVVVLHLVRTPVSFPTTEKYSDGGGVLGRILAAALLKAFGSKGTYIVLVAATLIAIELFIDTPLSRQTQWVAGRFTGVFGLLGRGLVHFGQGLVDELSQLRDWLFRRKGAEEEFGDLEEEETEELPLGAKQETLPLEEELEVEEEELEPLDEEHEEVPSKPSKKPPKSGSASVKKPKGTLRLPPLSLLQKKKPQPVSDDGIQEAGELLLETLRSFGIEAKIANVLRGPVVTRFEIQPPAGIKVSRITGLADDIALALAAQDVRIEAPVPGKSVVGVEVPNRETESVYLRELLDTDEFRNATSKLAVAVGKNVAGKPVIASLDRLPHLLIAGATGSGKSVCINCIIASLLYGAKPDEVKLILIDPKRVELAVYDGIPHLIAPVVTDPRQASETLKWVVREMERRYSLFAEVGVRNIDGYNRWVEKQTTKEPTEAEEELAYLSRIVVVIDELADLMMVAAKDVEESICRLAQMARAAGIYLVIATQRPSVDVITGLIKANIPSRIAFAVSSGVDSRTILDCVGAERLLGKGDMLFYPMGATKPFRAQGAFVSDEEVNKLVTFWKKQGSPEYIVEITEPDTVGDVFDETDELYDEAVQLVLETGQASVSMLQRRFRIGYNRAGRLIDMMEARGIVGPSLGSKPREVLVRSTEYKATE